MKRYIIIDKFPIPESTENQTLIEFKGAFDTWEEAKAFINSKPNFSDIVCKVVNYE